MAIRISLFHKIKYQYDRKVSLSPHLFRLKPAAHAHALIENYEFTVQPSTHRVHWQQDLYGNSLARVDFFEPAGEMSAEVRLQAILEAHNPFDFLIDDYALNFPFVYPSPIRNDLLSYLEITDAGPALSLFVNEARALEGDIVSFLVKLNNMVFNRIGYIQRTEEGIRSCEQTLEFGTGACRDSAWVLIQVLRHLGLASRYVSGYLVQFIDDPVSGKADLHAWTEVYIPGAGWIGLDTTSGLFAGEGHIPLASAPRPADAATITGTTDICRASITYENTVVRL
jgi:transglutaminase-like putative cysteine protease